MPKYCLTARFPLGIYLGHTGDANRDAYPDPARLHAALMNAAAQGVHAEEDPNEHQLRPSQQSLQALQWLEAHPPTGLAMPEQQWLSPDTSRMMYRNVGSVKIDKTGVTRATENRVVSDGVSVNGAYGYIWDEMPVDIAEAITALLPDVACLGEASSLVVLEQQEIEATLTLDPQATAFSTERVQVRIALPGRTQHLRDVFHARYGKKPPSKKADKFLKDDPIHDPPIPKDHLGTARYLRVNAADKECATPWTKVILLEVHGKQLGVKEQVRAAVALHRALIARIRTDVSPVITGRYAAGAQRPANNLAIQYIPHRHLEALGLKTSAFALLVPQDADSTVYEQLNQALTGPFPLRSGGKFLCQLKYNGHVFRGDAFWPAPQPGTIRMWEPLNVFIPESRPHNKQQGVLWRLADAGLLSVAFVWRDNFPTKETGPARYVELRDAAYNADVRIFHDHPVSRNTRSFVHRTNRSLTIQPWRGLVHLGSLQQDRAIIALGQSRHLGGGLLIPVDIPRSEFETMTSEMTHA